MESLIIEATANTPAIKFDAKKHIFVISGESKPEDSRKFYAPVVGWFEKYKIYLDTILKEEDAKIVTITFDIKFVYFNSSSAKFIMDIFFILKECKTKFKDLNVVINWFYNIDDEDMQEAGIEFEKLTGIEFDLLSYRD